MKEETIDETGAKRPKQDLLAKHKEKKENLGKEERLDANLKKTEIGEWFLNNKEVFSIAAALLIAGLIGYGIYSNQQDKLAQEVAATVYAFEQKELAEYSDGKIDAQAFGEEFNQLDVDIDGHEAGFAFYLEVASTALKRGDAALSETILRKNFDRVKKYPYLHFFYAHSLAAALEDQKKYGEAITTLQGILGGRLDAGAARTHFTIGRLHHLSGDISKAKEKFNHVITKYPQSSQVLNLSKAFLLQLETK